MASALQRDAAVTPTIRDVRGVPVPGVSGVPAHPPAGTARFRDMLHGLLPPKAPAPHTPIPAPAPRVPPPRPVSSLPDTKAALASRIRDAAGTVGVEPALSVAIARAESSLDPRARSSDGLSVGTFQMTHATAAEMRKKIAAGRVQRPAGTDDVALGVGYLRYLHDVFGRSAKLAQGLHTVPVADADERRLFAVAAFNAGEGRVAQAQARAAATGGDPTRFDDVRPFLPKITQGYVERVTAYARAETATAVA